MVAQQFPVQATREQVLWFEQSFTAPECSRGIGYFLYLIQNARDEMEGGSCGEIQEVLVW